MFIRSPVLKGVWKESLRDDESISRNNPNIVWRNCQSDSFFYNKIVSLSTLYQVSLIIDNTILCLRLLANTFDNSGIHIQHRTDCFQKECLTKNHSDNYRNSERNLLWFENNSNNSLVQHGMKLRQPQINDIIPHFTGLMFIYPSWE